MSWIASGPKVVVIVMASVLVAACSKNPEVVKVEYFKSAQEFAKKGQVDQAILQYRNAIKTDAKYGEARLELGKLLLQSRKPANLADARAQLVRAADLLPKNADAQLRAAQIHLLAGEYDDATNRANKALALDPKNVSAQLVKGNALANLKKYDDAIAQIEDAIALDPTQSGSYGNLGALQFALGHQPEAEAALKRAVEVAPTQMEPRIALASFYVATRKIDLAEETLSMALREQPRNTDVNRALASMYLVTGRPDKAEAPLKIVVEEKKDLRSRLMLADYYRSVKRVDEALAQLDQAAAAAGGLSPAMTRKATILRQQGKNGPAYQVLEDVLKKNPSDTGALVLKSMFLADDGKRAAAQDTIEVAVKAEPSTITYFVRGRINQLRGNFPAATADYLETLKLQPKHPEALRRLAEISLAGLRLDEARRYVQDALRLQPGNPDLLLIQARIETALGNHGPAEEILRKLATAYPKSGAVQAQLGTLYAAKQDLRAARAAYERASSLQPGLLEPIAGLLSLDMKAGNKAAARARADAALAKFPRSAPLLVTAAQTYMATGDARKAEDLLRSAISEDSTLLPAYGMLAQIYLSQERIGEAITELEKVAHQQPDSVAAPTLIAMLLEQQNKVPEAQAKYEEILRKQKSAPIAANNLAWIYAEHGGASLDAALDLAQTAKKGLPESAEVSDTLGWIYYKKKMAPQAIAALKEAATRDPKNVLTQYHLGLAYMSNSDYALAKGILAGALKAQPNAPSAREARSALDLIANIGL